MSPTARMAARAYRSLLRLYPRSFRDEYGPDLELLLADQLRDEPPARVLGRVLVDLVTTVPARHLEAHMRPNRHLVPAAFLSIAAAGVTAAFLAGTSATGVVVGLAVAATGLAASVASWRGSRTAPRGGSTAWWVWLLAGIGLIAAVVVAAGAGVQAWFLGLASLLAGGALVVVGLTLGAVQVVRQTHRGTPVG